MKIKKVIALSMCLAMLLLMVACGHTESHNDNSIESEITILSGTENQENLSPPKDNASDSSTTIEGSNPDEKENNTEDSAEENNISNSVDDTNISDSTAEEKLEEEFVDVIYKDLHFFINGKEYKIGETTYGELTDAGLEFKYITGEDIPDKISPYNTIRAQITNDNNEDFIYHIWFKNMQRDVIPTKAAVVQRVVVKGGNKTYAYNTNKDINSQDYITFNFDTSLNMLELVELKGAPGAYTQEIINLKNHVYSINHELPENHQIPSADKFTYHETYTYTKPISFSSNYDLFKLWEEMTFHASFDFETDQDLVRVAIGLDAITQ